VFREKEKPENFHFFRNMLPEDFLRLLCRSTAIVGNSSVAIRECSYLGVPAVNIGSRQMGRERGRNVIDVDHDRAAIAAAVREHIRRGRPEPDPLYGDGRAGPRIADTIASADLTIEKRLAY
jgi:UDP-N-acetylglucosamine 2-epimerase